MSTTVVRAAPLATPVHAILLAFPVALYSSALLADITYLNTAVVQWTNFAQWLVAGADLFAGLLLAWAAASYVFGRARHHRRRGALYVLIVAVMFVIGILNAFQHSKDGWASVGTVGVLMSATCAALAIVAAIIAHSSTVEPRTYP